MHSKKRIILKVTLLLLPASLAGTTHKRKHFPIIKIHTYLPLFPLPEVSFFSIFRYRSFFACRLFPTRCLRVSSAHASGSLCTATRRSDAATHGVADFLGELRGNGITPYLKCKTDRESTPSTRTIAYAGYGDNFKTYWGKKNK